MSNQPTTEWPAGGDDASQPKDRVKGPVTAADLPPVESNETTWKRMIPVIACGAGLFSDGYINNVSFTTLPLFSVS